MNNSLNLVELALLLSMIAIIMYISIISFLIYKELKKKRIFEQMKMDIEYHIDASDFLILDKLIEESFNQYKILHIETLNVNFIKTDIQNKMVEDLLTIVLKRISPVYLNKLRYIYNIEYIEDIILEKIKIMVISFSVETNGTLE